MTERLEPYATLDAGGAVIRFFLGDCLHWLPRFPSRSIDAIVTSPPYNLGIKYHLYEDGMPRGEYLAWTGRWVAAAAALLAPQGSLFLNVGAKPTDPWVAMDIAQAVRPHLRLQNTIHWVKSIVVERDAAGAGAGLERDLAVGHYKPINSPRFLNDCHEFIFHFTPSGETPLDRRAIGVPYQDKSNVTRWRSAGADRRCRGNAWFLPYDTINSREKDRPHPATFPVRLPEYCLRLHGLGRAHVVMDPFAGLGNTAMACAARGLDFGGEAPSLATPVRLHLGDSPDKLIRLAERAYVHKIIEGNFPVEVDQLSVALFGNADRAPYMQDLVTELIAEGCVQPRNGGLWATSRDVSRLLADRIFSQPRLDLEAQPPPEGIATSSAAETVFQEGTKLRTVDFAAAADCYLQAMQLQQLALAAGERGAAVDDFKWYLASYCSVKAGQSFVARTYDAAVPYYLAFFALVREGDLVYEKVKGLINPMLAYYFAIAPRRMGVIFHRNTDAPKVAVMLCNHFDPAVQVGWQNLVRMIAEVNAPLLVNLADQVPIVAGLPEGQIQRTASILRGLAKEGTHSGETPELAVLSEA